MSLLAVGAVAVEALDPDASCGRLDSPFASIENREFYRRRRQSARTTLWTLLAKKLIKAQGRKAQRTFQLTEEGLNRLFSRFPVLKYQHQPWDGYWRMIIYDIPEKEYRLRGKLRATLKTLGYKFIQKSVWATPLPVETELEVFLRKEGLWGKVLAIKAILSADENKRLAKVFNLKDSVLEKE